MAAPSMRVVRRPKGQPARRSLTAASQLVVDPKRSMRSSIGSTGPRTDWQVEAWKMVDLVGELRYWLTWISSSCSRVQFVASEVDPDTGLPTGGLTQGDDGTLSGEQARVAEIVKSIAGGPLGQAQLRKRSAECLSIPGEHWVILIKRGKTNGKGQEVYEWFVLAKSEWKTTGNGTIFELPDDTKHEFVKGVDVMFRVWNPRPQMAREPDSPVRANLDSCREIIRTTKKIKNASKSRLIGNGVVFLPQEMSMPASQAPVPEGLAEIPGAEVPIVSGVPAAEELSDQLYQTATAAVEDEDSQAAFIPLLATVPGEHLGKILHLKFGNEITEVEIKTRNDAIARLAMGLNVSPERLLGVGSNSNHWSAWQIADEDVQTHIKPIIETLCQAINEHALRAVLTAEGIDADKYMLWYDASGLTADPDLSDEAENAKDQGALRNEFYLRALGLPDDAGYDLTTLEGAQVWAREAIMKDPTLLADPAMQMLLGGELETIQWPEPVQPALPPGASEEADEDETDEGTGSEPETEKSVTASVQPSRADETLAERMLVNRCLDLANKRRVRGNEQKARLARIPSHEWHRYLPPLAEADIPRAIKDWDALAGDQISEGLRAAVMARVRDELTRPVIDAEVS